MRCLKTSEVTVPTYVARGEQGSHGESVWSGKLGRGFLKLPWSPLMGAVASTPEMIHPDCKEVTCHRGVGGPLKRKCSDVVPQCGG